MNAEERRKKRGAKKKWNTHKTSSKKVNLNSTIS
jgi:hypothetical protein